MNVTALTPATSLGTDQDEDPFAALYGAAHPPTLSFEEALPDATERDLEQLKLLFPSSPPPFRPMGKLVLVQDRSPRTKIGSILITAQTQDRDSFTERMGRIISIGPMAFWDDLGGGRLPGAPWYVPGEFVLLPKFSSTRYVGPGKKSSEDPDEGQAIFRLLNFNDVQGGVLSVRDIVL